MSLSPLPHRKTLLLGLIGAIVAVVQWSLFAQDGLEGGPAYLAALKLAVAIFGLALLTLLPRLPGLTATISAAVLGLLCGLLAWQGMAGFESFNAFSQAVQMPVALLLLATIPLPFIAAGFQAKRGWRHYQSLFDLSWGMAFSWATSLVFVGISWLVLYACHALLRFVGIDLLELLFQAPIWVLISGLLLGVALSITAESDGYLSPVVLLKLMRLLTPVLLVVMLIFLVALPFQGAEASLPLAAITVCTVFGASTLISAVVADDDHHASASPFLLSAARILSAMMPIFAAVALWAVVLRISQYGLTPARVCGVLAALIAGGYGAGYLWAALHRIGWMQRIRQVNIIMALAMVVLAVLWLARIVSPEAWSASSQLSRFQSGVITQAQLPLYQMKKEWGLAGERAYQRLLDEHQIPENAWQMAASHDPDIELSADDTEAIARQVLVDKMESVPANHPLRESFTRHYPGWDAEWLATACNNTLPSGQPACLLVFADFDPSTPGEEALVLAHEAMHSISIFAMDDEGKWQRMDHISHQLNENTADLINDLRTNGLRLAPAPFNVLKLGEGYIGMEPK